MQTETQTIESKDLIAKIDRMLLIGKEFSSIHSPAYELLREAGATILKLEEELDKLKEEHDAAQGLLLNEENRNEPRACTERGWI